MLKRIIVFLLGFSLCTSPMMPAWAQSGGNSKEITLNFVNADLAEFINYVKEVTGKTIIPHTLALSQGIRVNLVSNQKLNPAQFYEIFVKVLALNGLAAVTQGGIISVVPNTEVRTMASDSDLKGGRTVASDEYLLETIKVNNVNAISLATPLRQIMTQQGATFAFPQNNTIVLLDRASNVRRMIDLIRRIDQSTDNGIDSMRLEYATASDVKQTVDQLFAATSGGEGSMARTVADDRTNTIFFSGEEAQRTRMKLMVARLDEKTESGGGTQVIDLEFADVESVVDVLTDQAEATAQVVAAGSPPGAPAGGAAGNRGGNGGLARANDVTILGYPENNQIIITAPPKVMTALLEVIKQLDRRRLQVQVEAIIVEVSTDKTAELGINWAVFSEEDDTRIPVGGFLSPVGGVSIVDLANAVDDPSTAPPGLVNGTTVGIGRIVSGGVNFAAMLRALRGDGTSNVLDQPVLMTMDNEEADFQNITQVPFQRGSFTNTGGGGGGAVNPFTTTEQIDVGTKLKVTPQISPQGKSLRLDIEVESSGVAANSTSTTNPTTIKRSIVTKVEIEDGGIVVLGGLISDASNDSEQRVPFLGRIPILGNAFKVRKADARKTNLMIFLRPKILRDPTDAAEATNTRYEAIQDEQRKANKREALPMLPGNKKPVLPDPPPVPARTTPPVPTGTEERTAPPAPPLREQ